MWAWLVKYVLTEINIWIMYGNKHLNRSTSVGNE